MSIWALMTHSLTIRRLESASVAGTPAATLTDAWGHPAVLVAGTPTVLEPPSFADYLAVRGAVQERSGQEIQGAELQGTVVTDTRIFLPVGTDVRTQDRVRNEGDGLEYDVLVVRDAAGRSHHLELDARRIQA